MPLVTTYMDFVSLHRPFSNIDEDIDDIECDNPECPEEIQELKQEILSAYQVCKSAKSKSNNLGVAATQEYVWDSEAKGQTKEKLK